CRAFQCADAHHEKLVQVRAQDGEKSDPGKERNTRILRQLQYPGIELDQAQVAIQEVLWPRAVDVENGGAEREVGQSHPALAHLARGGFALRLAGAPPFGQDVRPRRQRERRERPWVTQGGRASRREQLVERQPPDPSGVPRVPTAGSAPRQPHLEHGSRTCQPPRRRAEEPRSEEHTSELQSLPTISYAVFCLKKKKKQHTNTNTSTHQKTKKKYH